MKFIRIDTHTKDPEKRYSITLDEINIVVSDEPFQFNMRSHHRCYLMNGTTYRYLGFEPTFSNVPKGVQILFVVDLEYWRKGRMLTSYNTHLQSFLVY